MPSATQAALAAGRMKYSNYSGLPHMVTGLKHRLVTRKEREGRERRCLEFGLLHFIVAVKGKSKTEEIGFLPRTQKIHQNTLEKG